jgi:hypothetical protein
MAYNTKQKKKMKLFIIVAAVAAGLYYAVFKTVSGKGVVNGIALKMGIGTTAKPLIA